MKIEKLSFGGDPTKTAKDYFISLDNLRLQIAFQLDRAKNLLALDTKTGHDTRPHTPNKKSKPISKPFVVGSK